MDSPNKMTKYDDVNREIQELLSRRNNAGIESHQNTHSNPKDILPLLESLNKTYNDINTYLKTENPDALKDVILKSDIKMSMVCETLLDTLRQTVEDKNKLNMDLERLDKLKREIEERESRNKILIAKLESELDFKSGNNNELNRVIRDQKERIAEYKEETLKSKSDASFLKIKISELENLRNKATERLQVYERELEGLNIYIKERDEMIRKLQIEKKEEENKNSNVKKKILELERMIEILNNKNETREKNLSLCNNELSKVLMENKTMKTDFEKYKESSVYYENLYNNLNKQNAYLNSQLNRMLKDRDYSKESADLVRKYKKKARRNKKKARAFKLEIENLQNATMNHEKPSDTSDSLIKRIDELTTKNKDYKTRIMALEADKKEIESKISKLERKPEHIYNQHRLKIDKLENKAQQYTLNRNKETEIPSNSHRIPMPSNHTVPTFNKNHIAHPQNLQYSYKYNNPADNYIATPSNNHMNPPSNNFNSANGYFRTTADPNRKNDDYYTNLNNPVFGADTKKYNDVFSTPVFTKPLLHELEDTSNKNYMKLFNLDNTYDKKEPNDFLGGFPDDTELSLIKHTDLQHDYDIPQLKNEPKAEFIDPRVNDNYIKKEGQTFNNAKNIRQSANQESSKYKFEPMIKQIDHSLLNGNKGIVTSKDNISNNTGLNREAAPKKPISETFVNQWDNIKNTLGNEISHANVHQASNPHTLEEFKKNREGDTNNNPFQDEQSDESIKTYHTTSTLKDMMARTDNLQKKFETLEQQLANIKEGDSESKLADKIKTYNNYYSDWNIESNDDEIL
jgi:hypothetical protein